MNLALETRAKSAMASRILELADDELILAHRDSEWTGHAPILEEDIAFANIAQDEMGHALVWYGIYHSLTDQDPDQLVFFREPSEFRNIQLVELPKGDWAFSIVRQWMFDTWEMLQLEAFQESRFRPIADAARKIRREETYHLRHTSAWLRRLGLGTEESNRRMQDALEQLWSFHGQMFASPPDYDRLVDQSLMPDLGPLSELWLERVGEELTRAGLQVPRQEMFSFGRYHHSYEFRELVQELQLVARLEDEARW